MTLKIMKERYHYWLRRVVKYLTYMDQGPVDHLYLEMGELRREVQLLREQMPKKDSVPGHRQEAA